MHWVVSSAVLSLTGFAVTNIASSELVALALTLTTPRFSEVEVLC